MICFPPKPMWDIIIHPPSGPSVLAVTLSFLQSTWDRPQIHPPLGPSILTSTPHVSTLLRGTARRLAHQPVSGSDTICNDPNSPSRYCPFWAFSFGIPGFHTRGLFSSPTNVGHHSPHLTHENFFPWTRPHRTKNTPYYFSII